ncbi:hypothetical protein L1049_006778 [Liquidambar formosana]|uniref:Cytochrome P450 n=1 Tax=Liquidambar formosana TaxID=63359 RepID=A0AAP0WRU4_LIQFO
MSNVISGMWSWWWDDAGNEKGGLHGAILAVSVAMLALLWSLWTAKKSRNLSAPLPPGPRGLPIVGYLPFLGSDIHRTFTQLARVYGPIYKLWLGNKLCVVLNSPSLVREVARDQDTTFADCGSLIPSLTISYGGNNIAFSSYGPEWRKLRKIFVRQMLSNVSLDACYALRREEVKKTIRDVYDKIGTPVKIGELTLLMVINAVMSMVWDGTVQGEKGSDIGAELPEVLSEIMVLLAKPNVSDFFPRIARFDVQGIEKRMKNHLHWCDRIFNSATDIRRNMDGAKVEGAGKNEERKDFLPQLTHSLQFWFLVFVFEHGNC